MIGMIDPAQAAFCVYDEQQEAAALHAGMGGVGVPADGQNRHVLAVDLGDGAGGSGDGDVGIHVAALLGWGWECTGGSFAEGELRQ
jgi:hypothetical protein